MGDFKTGDKVLDKSVNKLVTLLGPEDFEKYEYNRPSDEWELVEYEDGLRVWCPSNNLEVIKG